jgi:hypothetical protein
LVEGGQHLWRCLCYIELNMVRCGVVSHPREWEWVGYHELIADWLGDTRVSLAPRPKRCNYPRGPGSNSHDGPEVPPGAHSEWMNPCPERLRQRSVGRIRRCDDAR